MLDLSISNGITRLAPEKELELIAFHGFTHIHWSLHFSGDYLYSSSEIAHYAGMLKNSGVQIQDLHAPCGSEKCFYAAEKFRRCAGVDMILNRVELLAAMDVPQASLVVHIPNMNDIFYEQNIHDAIREQYKNLRFSLDELMERLPQYGNYRIAVENMPYDNFEIIRQLLAEYPADFLGLAFDSGHAHIGFAHGIEHAENLSSRICALHIHDNDGVSDLHKIPFTGTSDMPRLAELIANSASNGVLNLEVSMKNEMENCGNDINLFLKNCFESGEKLVGMINGYRNNLIKKGKCE